MKNKGTWVLFVLVILLSTYAYFGEYKGKEKEMATKEEQSKIFKDLKAEQVNKISIESDSQKVLLSRSTEGWTLLEPIQDSADSEGVDSWIKQLADEKTLATAVEGSDIQWQFFGFDKKVTKLSLFTSTGSTSTIEISEKKNFENNSFVRFPGQNKIYVASSSWSSHASKKPFDLRNKKLFRHQISNIQSVSIKNKKGTVKFESKDARWITPEKNDWVLDQNKVRESIAKINEMVATEVFAESLAVPKEKLRYSFSNPDITFEVKLNDKKWEAAIVQNKDKSIVMWANEPNLIVKIDNNFFEKFSKIVLEDYRDTKLPFLLVDKSKVKNIDFETSLKKSSLIEKNGNWELAKEDSAVVVQQEKVKQLVETIKDLNVLNYVNESEFKKTKINHKVSFLDQERKSIFELSMSDSFKKKIDNTEKSLRVAKTNLYNEPFILEEAEVEKLHLNELTKIKNDEKTLPPDGKDLNSLPKK